MNYVSETDYPAYSRLMQALGLRPRKPADTQENNNSDPNPFLSPASNQTLPEFDNADAGNSPGGNPRNQTLNSGSQVTESNVFSKIIKKGIHFKLPTEYETFSKEDSKNHVAKFSARFLRPVFDDQSKYNLQELTSMKNTHATPAAVRNAAMYVPDVKAEEEKGPWVIPEQPQDLLLSNSSNRKIMQNLPISRLIDRRGLFSETDSLAPKTLSNHFGKPAKHRFWEKGPNTKNRSHSHAEGIFVFETHCRMFAAHEASLKVTAALTDVASALCDDDLADTLPEITNRFLYLLELLGRINGINLCELQALRRKDIGERGSEVWYRNLLDIRQKKLKNYPHVAKKHDEIDKWGFPEKDTTPKLSDVIKRDFHNLANRLKGLQKSEHITQNEVILTGTNLVNTVGYTTILKSNSIKRKTELSSTKPAKKQKVDGTANSTVSTTIPKKLKKKKKKKNKKKLNKAGN